MPSSAENAHEIATFLADNYLEEKLSTISLIDGPGEVNQVYEVTTDTKKAVLRIHDRSEYPRYQKEQWCVSAAREKGVLTPQILHVGQDDECAYMLLDFIEGNNGREIKDTNDTWFALGKMLRQIHSVPVRGFGDTLADITEGSPTHWDAYLHDNIRSLSGKSILVNKGILNNAQVNVIENLLKSLLDSHFTFGLNHGDYSLANVIIDDSANPHVIDWGSAQAHVVPHHDLAVILEESLDEGSEKYLSLLSGYGMVRQDYLNISREIKLLQLLDAVDKVRWAIDKAPARLEHHSTRLTTFIAKAEL